MDHIERWAKLIRDVGIILGIPVIIVIASNLYSAQLGALKEQNELLKQTQYDKALSLIEAQQKLSEHEQRLITETVDIVSRLLNAASECSEHFQSDGDDYCSPDLYERWLQQASQNLIELREITE